MTKKWIGINLLLLFFAVATGWHFYDSVQQFKADHDLSKIRSDNSLSQMTAQDTVLPPPYESGLYNPSNFNIISEKNVFSASRTTEDSTEETPTGTMPVSQKPTLVGVIITGNQRVASIIEPQGRGQSTQAQLKRIGDVYEGYTITEIESDHIVLDNGRQKEIIYLNDSATQNRQTGAAKASTRVVHIGDGASGADIPVTIVSGKAGSTVPSRPRTAPQPANSRAEGNTRNLIGPGPATRPNGQQPASQAPQTSAPQPTTNTTSPAPGSGVRSRVVRSPFGDIIRNP